MFSEFALPENPENRQTHRERSMWNKDRRKEQVENLNSKRKDEN